MGKAVEIDHEFDKEKFASLLRTAIGSTKIGVFASKAGLSFATLTHYLNKFNSNPPTPTTIIKIADASEGRMLAYFLLYAAGYEPFKYIKSSTCYSSQQIKVYIAETFLGSPYVSNVVLDPNINDSDFMIIMNDNCPFKRWFFKIMTDSSYSILPEVSIKSYISNLLYDVKPNSGDKFSIVVDNEELFNMILSNSLEYDIFVTLILIDSNGLKLIKENTFNTPAIAIHSNYTNYTMKKVITLISEL